MNNNKPKILIIGGSGYIGNHLIENYLKEYDVFFTGTKERSTSQYFRIDFEHEKSYGVLKGKEFNLVIIFASVVEGLDTVLVNSEYIDVNVNDFSKFLQFLIDKEISDKLIYISSMTVYHEGNVSPVVESAKTLSGSTYGLTKLLAEKLFEFACERNNGLNGVVFRLPGVYGGKRKSGYIYSLIQKLKNNEDVSLTTNGLQYWETMHVDDVCKVLNVFLSKYLWSNKYDVFNISYGEETDFINASHFVKNQLNSESKITHKGKLGYVPFYMSNDKIQKLIKLEMSYEKSLMGYVLNEVIEK